MLCGSAICCAVAQVVTHLRADALPQRHKANTRVAAANLKNLKDFIWLVEKQFADEYLGISAAALHYVIVAV